MFVEHKEAVEITEAPAKTLKLSEAIRIGCKMTTPGKHHYVSGRAACALGAAMIAVGMSQKEACEGGVSALQKNIPDVWDALRKLPFSAQTENDIGRMTREQIADAIEGAGY